MKYEICLYRLEKPEYICNWGGQDKGWRFWDRPGVGEHG